jgi:hypothetical protein
MMDKRIIPTRKTACFNMMMTTVIRTNFALKSSSYTVVVNKTFNDIYNRVRLHCWGQLRNVVFVAEFSLA